MRGFLLSSISRSGTETPGKTRIWAGVGDGTLQLMGQPHSLQSWKMLWLPTAYRAEPQVPSLTFKADPNLAPVCCSGKVYPQGSSCFRPSVPLQAGLAAVTPSSQVMLPRPSPGSLQKLVACRYPLLPPQSSPAQSSEVSVFDQGHGPPATPLPLAVSPNLTPHPGLRSCSNLHFTSSSLLYHHLAYFMSYLFRFMSFSHGNVGSMRAGRSSSFCSGVCVPCPQCPGHCKCPVRICQMKLPGL